MSIEIKGRWKKGFAHDVHTLSSVYMGVDEYGHDQWDRTRSEMDELVYQLKYHGDTSVIPRIVDLLGKYKGLETMDAIIPIPSTNKHRVTQPVYAIARELGKRLGISVIEDALVKSAGGPQLKNVDDQNERENLLRDHIALTDDNDLSGGSYGARGIKPLTLKSANSITRWLILALDSRIGNKLIASHCKTKW